MVTHLKFITRVAPLFILFLQITLSAQIKVEANNFDAAFNKNPDKYIKKKIVIAGKVYNSKPDLYGDQIISIKCGDKSLMNCYINTQSNKAVSNIKSNDYIEIEGILKSFKTDDNLNYIFDLKDAVVKTVNKISDEDEQAIQKTVTSYFNAIDNGDLAAASYYLANEKKKSLQKFLKKVIAETDYYRITNVEILKIADDKSTVKVQIYQKRYQIESEEYWDIEMQLFNEGGKWKILSAK